MTQAPVQIDRWLERFTPVAERLQRAIADVLAIPDNVDRVTDLSSAFDLGRTMAGRLRNAVAAENAREIALLLPGRPSMLRFIERAASVCEDKQLVNELQETYEEFIEYISQIAANHQELTAVLNAHDPEKLRESIDRKRAALFRANTDFIGGYAESISAINVAFPNAEGPRYGDWVFAHAYWSLRRLGAMQPITLYSKTDLNSGANEIQNNHHLDGKPVDINGDGTLVRELSSKNLPTARLIHVDDITRMMYLSDDLALGVPIDIVSASLQKRMIKNIYPQETGSEVIIAKYSVPTKIIIHDILIHQDMWHDIDPKFKVYIDGTKHREPYYPEDYWFFEVPYYEEIEKISLHRAMLPIHETPKHHELLQYVIEQMRLNIDDFRIYRLAIKHPAVGNVSNIFFSRKPEEKQT